MCADCAAASFRELYTLVSGSQPMLVSLWGTLAGFRGVDAGSSQLAHVLIACVQLMCRLVYRHVLPSAVRSTNYELPVIDRILRRGLSGKEHTYVQLMCRLVYA